jgi:hypothetical protein
VALNFAEWFLRGRFIVCSSATRSPIRAELPLRPLSDYSGPLLNALRTKPLEVREEYERQLKELQEAYGEAMLELRARKKLQSLLGEDGK